MSAFEDGFFGFQLEPWAYRDVDLSPLDDCPIGVRAAVLTSIDSIETTVDADVYKRHLEINEEGLSGRHGKM